MATFHSHNNDYVGPLQKHFLAERSERKPEIPKTTVFVRPGNRTDPKSNGHTFCDWHGYVYLALISVQGDPVKRIPPKVEQILPVLLLGRQALSIQDITESTYPHMYSDIADADSLCQKLERLYDHSFGVGETVTLYSVRHLGMKWQTNPFPLQDRLRGSSLDGRAYA